jgi:hypothetical protein
MTDLTRHAEQAVLGALVADPGRGAALDGLTVHAFRDGKHQAIFAALTGAVPAATGLLGRFRGWLTRLPLRRQIRDLRAYMDTLPGLCPDPDHITDYAAMLRQAQKRRDEGIEAEHGTIAGQVIAVTHDNATGQLQASQAWLDQAARQAAMQTVRGMQAGPASHPTGLPHAVQRLATALAAPDRTAQPVAQGQPLPAEPAASAPVAAGSAPRPPEQGDPATAAKNETLSTDDLQDLVLAGLLQHPCEGAAVTAWLPADVFTAGQRQWLYQVICDRVAAGQPIDPLIIAWHVSTSVAPAGPAASPEEIQRLGALPAVPGTAIVLGRALLAEHVCIRQFGPDWPESRAAVEPDAVQVLAGDSEPALAEDHDLEPAEQPGRQLVAGSAADAALPAVSQHGFGQDDATTQQVPLIQRSYGEQAGPQPVPRM